MTQATNFGVPTTGPASPDVMAARIQNNFEAALTGHSGAARPSYAEAGTVWQDTSIPNTIRTYLFDGENDRLLSTINTSTGKITFNDTGVLRFDDELELTDPQKEQARDNIGFTPALAAYNRWETIEDVELSAVASYSRTGLSAFRKLRISCSLFPSIPTGFYMQFSVGGVFASGTSDYQTQSIGAQGAGMSAIRQLGNSVFLTNGADVNASADEALIFQLMIERFNKASRTRCVGQSSAQNSSNDYLSLFGGQRIAAVANDGIRIIPGSGNLSGFITLEGVRG